MFWKEEPSTEARGLSSEEWIEISKECLIILESIERIHRPKLGYTESKEGKKLREDKDIFRDKYREQLLGNLDNILLNCFFERKLPGTTLYITDLFYPKNYDKSDEEVKATNEKKVIHDRTKLLNQAIQFLDNVNRKFYDNEKDFSILKKSIKKICNSPPNPITSISSKYS